MTDSTQESEPTGQPEQTVETMVPARLDRLPWSVWHLRIVIALGTSWLLDGLQVTLAGSLAGILENKHGLGLSAPQVTAGASLYLSGAVVGALFFGYLTDRLGRRKLFLVTLATYSIATLLTAFSFNFWSFALFRALTGCGIGGEYAAINSAVDELIPGKVRGTVDLVVNATFWLGAIVGSLASFGLLNTHWIPTEIGWRAAFSIAALLGGGVLVLRLAVPESPRWLMLRGHEEEAERVVGEIEKKVRAGSKKELPKPEGKPLKLAVRDHTPWGDVFQSMFRDNRSRSVLALLLMVGQSFFFNSVFFTYGLVVKRFYDVSDQRLPLHLVPFAVGSFLGPIVFGHLFDRIGRKPMIAATYGISGIMLAGVIYPFLAGKLSAVELDLCFSAIFLVASSAASAAYLTVSEIFPLEIRAFAIAIFYALGTLAGGVGAPLLFGELIATGSRGAIAWGWGLGAALMLIAAIAEMFIGVEAAGQSLESVSKPIQSR
jgi:MFS family permease